MSDQFRREQEFYQDLVAAGRVTLDEAALLRRVVPLALVRKLLGFAPEFVQPTPGAETAKITLMPLVDPTAVVPLVDPVVVAPLILVSPNGTRWQLSITDQGKARTEKV